MIQIRIFLWEEEEEEEELVWVLTKLPPGLFFDVALLSQYLKMSHFNTGEEDDFLA